MKSVSIVIPNYKKQPLLKHLPTVIKTCPQCEIIVVDDASPDDTLKVLKAKFPQVRVVVNKTNQRFAVSCNNGIKAATGDVVVLINSDVSPKPGFLKPLIKPFTDDQVFSASCLEIETKKGKQIKSGKNQCQFKRGFLIHSAAKITSLKKTTPNCWGSGGAMALDRQKYLKLGGMDPIYAPAYWEDIDLSWMARERYGWKILFEPKAQVYHNHETTNVSVFGKKKMELMAARNQFIFVWKNIRGRQLLEHWLWLPYHLTFTAIRTQGIFLLAFFKAIIHWTKYKYL